MGWVLFPASAVARRISQPMDTFGVRVQATYYSAVNFTGDKQIVYIYPCDSETLYEARRTPGTHTCVGVSWSDHVTRGHTARHSLEDCPSGYIGGWPEDELVYECEGGDWSSGAGPAHWCARH